MQSWNDACKVNVIGQESVFRCGGVADACKDVSAMDYESFEARKVVSPNKNTEQK